MRMVRRFLMLLTALLLTVPSVSLASKCAHSYRNGPRDKRRIAVTVDDCFNQLRLTEILDLCDQYRVKMTFFPVGKEIRETDRDLWRRVVDAGHEIGCHTNNHRRLTSLKNFQIQPEITGFAKRLNAALGYTYPLSILRPPYGSLGEGGGASCVGRELCSLGYPSLILWEVSEDDPSEALRQTRNGSILLYHTIHKDVECLKTLIPALLNAGYELVTVSELLHLDANGNALPATPEPADSVKQIAAAAAAMKTTAASAPAATDTPKPGNTHT